MTNQQWQVLCDVLAGKTVSPLPVSFIIDCPWLPGWANISTLDYFTQDRLWLEINRKAINEFPDILFLPGFWSEYGMCTEPSAFGAKCIWQTHHMPFAEKTIHSLTDIDRLTVPNPETDGLCPFALNRLSVCRNDIEALGHHIRFAVSRGPLNIASFLMGATEFLMALRDDTKRIHTLLNIITEFTIKWLDLQKSRFDTIDGILILDDIVGFCGPPDFEEFARPYLKAIYESQDVTVKMFHNDAEGRVCAPHLADLGVNLFNFSFLHSLKDMKEWTGNKVTLLGNIPPRDVLACGTLEQIHDSVVNELNDLEDKTRVIMSCGGGMPDSVTSEQIQAFVRAVHEAS